MLGNHSAKVLLEQLLVRHNQFGHVLCAEAKNKSVWLPQIQCSHAFTECGLLASQHGPIYVSHSCVSPRLSHVLKRGFFQKLDGKPMDKSQKALHRRLRLENQFMLNSVQLGETGAGATPPPKQDTSGCALH